MPKRKGKKQKKETRETHEDILYSLLTFHNLSTDVLGYLDISSICKLRSVSHHIKQVIDKHLGIDSTKLRKLKKEHIKKCLIDLMSVVRAYGCPNKQWCLGNFPCSHFMSETIRLIGYPDSPRNRLCITPKAKAITVERLEWVLLWNNEELNQYNDLQLLRKSKYCRDVIHVVKTEKGLKMAKSEKTRTLEGYIGAYIYNHIYGIMYHSDKEFHGYLERNNKLIPKEVFDKYAHLASKRW